MSEREKIVVELQYILTKRKATLWRTIKTLEKWEHDARKQGRLDRAEEMLRMQTELRDETLTVAQLFT